MTAAKTAQAVLTAFLLAVAWLTISPSSSAQASGGYVGDRILNMAETRYGDWYVFGADGPSTFDCSGLVAWSAAAAGEQNWPRDTYDIASEIGSRFSITDYPQRGDLALWGPASAPYHVEIVTAWNDTTFGAQDPGTQVGWHYHYPGYGPSFYLHINY